jgi:hypothetical protein
MVTDRRADQEHHGAVTDQQVDVKIYGTRELASGSRRLFENIGTAADREFRTTADQVASLVRGRVPRLTGRLASSVVGEPVGESGSTMVGMGEGLLYAGWIEFGGGHGRAYIDSGRYLTPVATNAGPLLKRAGETAANNEIRRMLWPTPTEL